MLVVPVVVAGGTITAITLGPDSSPSRPGAVLHGTVVRRDTVAFRAAVRHRFPVRHRLPVGTDRCARPAPRQPWPSRSGPVRRPRPKPGRRPPWSPGRPSSPGSVSRLRNVSADQCASGDGSVYPWLRGLRLRRCLRMDVALLRRRHLRVGQPREWKLSVGALQRADDAAGLEACGGVGGTGYVVWRIGSTTAAGQTLKNTRTGHCLEIASPAYGGGKQVMVATGNSDEPQQLWNNGGTA